MTILLLLLPVAVLFVLVTGAVLAWAVLTGQYDDADSHASSVLPDD